MLHAPLAQTMPAAHRIAAYAAVICAVIMAVLDSSLVNIALPLIARDFGIASADTINIVTGYQIAMIGSLLPFAALSASFGTRRVFLGGAVVFGLASLVCARAPNIETLVLARFVQGLGGSAMMSLNGSIVRNILPPERLGLGLSGLSLAVGLSAATGPSLAAAIISLSSWHWLFLINIPVVLVVLTVGQRVIPELSMHRVRFDLPSAALNAAGFALLIIGLKGLAEVPARSAVLIGAAILVFGLLYQRERGENASNLLPLDLLARPLFRRAAMASVLIFIAQFLVIVSVPFYFHDRLGLSVVQAGLNLTPWAMLTAASSPIAGWLSDYIPRRVLAAVGASILAVSLFFLAWWLWSGEAGSSIAWPLAACGMGFGTFTASNNRTMLTSVALDRASGASGTQSTARLLGQALGASLGAVLLASGWETSFEIGLFIGGLSAVAAGILSAIRLARDND